ncbi:MAG: helix-turn-helix transcriptional regulator [Actinomycetes bacterium]
MGTDDFADRVAGVAALAEPVRRELYLYVVAQPAPVSRDEASRGVDVPRHTAKFHLDKLVEEGLLDTEFRRLSERRGPGAGRPTKLYRRSDRQVSVTLPERRYDLAGQLMATAIDESTQDGSPVVAALQRAAADLGATLGDRTRAEAGVRPSRERLVSAACATLAAHGYEPRREGGTVTLANCPFHALAREHTELVCHMNLALVDALAERAAGGRLTARLDPAPDRCCVVLTSP